MQPEPERPEANHAVHRTGARACAIGASRMSTVGFAGDGPFQAPVGDFGR